MYQYAQKTFGYNTAVQILLLKKNIVASILDTDELLSGIYISDQR